MMNKALGTSNFSDVWREAEPVLCGKEKSKMILNQKI